MVRRGQREKAVALLRETLGELRAEIVIAAMTPKAGNTVEPAE